MVEGLESVGRYHSAQRCSLPLLRLVLYAAVVIVIITTIIITIMYIYHALINGLNAHMIHININLNMIFFVHT